MDALALARIWAWPPQSGAITFLQPRKSKLIAPGQPLRSLVIFTQEFLLRLCLFWLGARLWLLSKQIPRCALRGAFLKPHRVEMQRKTVLTFSDWKGSLTRWMMTHERKRLFRWEARTDLWPSVDRRLYHNTSPTCRTSKRILQLSSIVCLS